MFCPFCQAEDTKVIDSRLVTDGTQIRRRRSCEVCLAVCNLNLVKANETSR